MNYGKNNPTRNSDHSLGTRTTCARLGMVLLLAVIFAGCGLRNRVPDMHVVIIGVDGLSPDGIEHAPTPHMDGLIAEGAYTKAARAVLPSSSSPNWASMINGASPEQHGVLSNAWQPDDFSIAPTDTGVGSIFPSIFDLVTQEYPTATTASIYDWGGFGRLYNGTAVTIDIDGDGPQATADSAMAIFGREQPLLTFVHLDHVDIAGHRHGHGTPLYYESVAEADRLIGLILDGLEEAGMRQKTTVIVSSDHGGVGYGHGGESMAEMEIPWIAAGPQIAAGIEISDPVDTYDTAVMAAFLLGISPPESWIGRPVYQALAETDAPAQPQLENSGIEHVMVIGVDGLSPDGVQKASTPIMNEIIPGGAYSFKARAVMTTSSSQNWASMVMGAGPEQHGITSNSWEPDSFLLHPTVMGPEDLFPSMFSELRRVEPEAKIAAIYDWGGFGRLIPSSVLDVDIDGDGPQDTVEQARAVLLQHRPRLTFVHLDHVDHALHTYGHNTEKYYDSVTEADRLIGELMDGLEAADMADQTLIIISSDHGGMGKGHGGSTMSEIEIPWIAYGPGVRAGTHLTIPINIFDIAPTALLGLGLEQPVAWIGRPVVSAFAQHSEPGSGEHVYVPAPRILPSGSDALLFEPVTVSMWVDAPDASIYYTLDGSHPTDQSTPYSGEFQVDASGVVQAVAVLDGHMSRVSRARFRILDEEHTASVRYEYYEGEWLVLPDFETLTALHSGLVHEFHLEGVPDRRENHYGIRYEGTLQVETPGRYVFYTRSDDGTRLFVDGDEVVNNDGSHGPLESSGSIELDSGPVNLVVEYFEDVGGEHLQVFYKGPDFSKRLLSFSELTSQ